MPPLHGRLETRIRIPTGGVSLTLSDSGGGPWVVTVPAGDYHLNTADSGSNSFLAELKAQLDASSSSITYSVTMGSGENGTGKVTIARSSGTATTFSITWSTTWLRDLLGFTATITAQSTATGANHVEAAWLPDCPHDASYGTASEGWDITDATFSMGPTRGAYRAYAYGNGVRQRIVWAMCTKKKVRADAETTVGESFQTFWRNFMAPSYLKTWATVGGPIRWYPDAGSLTYFEYYLTAPGSEFAPERVRADWDGLQRVTVEGEAA